MNKKNIITVIIAFVIGILIGNLIQIPKNTDKLVGSVMDNQSTIKRIVDEADIFNTDSYGNPIENNKIGLYKKISIFEIITDSDGQTKENLISCKVDFGFMDFAQEDYHKITFYKNNPDSYGTIHQEYVDSKVLHSGNNRYTYTYYPGFDEDFEIKETIDNNFSNYTIEYDGNKIVLGEMTTTEY